jgi:ABC-type transport system involved in cytochrome c biogenesis permease subunit
VRPIELVFLILTAAPLIGVFLLEILGRGGRRRESRILWILAFVWNTALLIFRTANAGHLPFANIFESLIFFAWTLELASLFFDLKSKAVYHPLGAWMSGMTVLVLILALTRPGTPGPLMPALQSPWFGVHVLTNFLAYALFSVAFFTVLSNLRRRALPPEWQFILDRALVLGFFFLALGISTGAAWAHEAWGTYWSWDPKETWALVTWMVFGLALHARFQRHNGLERGLTLFGYLCMWFTYMGVTYVLPGLHSYK